MHSVLSAQPLVLLGHTWVLDLLRRSLAQRSAFPAYLLTGPPQVGKFTTALAMASVLLCREGSGCGSCRHCRLALRRAHPDLRVLQLPPDRKVIPIRDVHEFIQGIALKPVEAERKVYILDGADLLSEDGADALLKTLEEPPSTVTLILTASDPAQLRPTVVSRCQRLALHPVPWKEIHDYLVEAHELEASAAETFARASRGCAGWAILAAQRPQLLEERRRRAQDLLRLLGASRLERIRYADSLAEQWSGHPEVVRGTLDLWVQVWRDVVRIQVGLSPSEGLTAPIGPQGRASESAERTGPGPQEAASILAPEAARKALGSTLQVGDALQANASPRLALETFLLLLPRLPKPAEP